MTKRTDPHRPGAIVPAEYEQVLSYSLSTSEGGWPIPAIGINCELEHRHEIPVEGPTLDGRPLPPFIVNGEHGTSGLCCVIGLRSVAKVKWAATGGTGKCSVCGACFVYGDVWKHLPTGEHLHLGHDCVAKYSMLADRSAWELENGRRRRAAAIECQRAQNAEEREAFLAKHPGLEEALKTEHGLIRDMAQKFTTYRSLSDKQVALVFKIAYEVANPKPAEAHVAAPVSDERVTFRGTVVSVRSHEGAYGESMKCTIKVQTDAGAWLAWGTAPSGMLGDASAHGGLKGCEVEVTAKLVAGREPHFAIMKRPHGVVRKLACGTECFACKQEKVS